MMISEFGSCKVYNCLQIFVFLRCQFVNAPGILRKHFRTRICKFIYFNFSVDTFVIETLAVGSLKRVRIGHDNKGVAAGWFLDKVR